MYTLLIWCLRNPLNNNIFSLSFPNASTYGTSQLSNVCYSFHPTPNLRFLGMLLFRCVTTSAGCNWRSKNLILKLFGFFKIKFKNIARFKSSNLIKIFVHCWQNRGFGLDINLLCHMPKSFFVFPLVIQSSNIPIK